MRTFPHLIALVLLFACSKGEALYMAPTPVNSPLPPPAANKTFLALGDSYTIGQSVPEAQRFPSQTAAILQQQGWRISSPVYIAQTGWTTTDLQAAIASRNLAPGYDVVTLLIGVNDQYRRMDTAGYARRFEELLQKAISLARDKKSNVFVVSIPDYSATPFVPAPDKARVSMEVDAIQPDQPANNRSVRGELHRHYTREPRRFHEFFLSSQRWPASLGLEYKKWAELLAPKIRAVL
jgi:hypothetical protein